MTQEIKLKLEQAAETSWEQDQKTNPTPVNPYAYVYGFKAGAKTILENPSEWGLCSLEVLEATSVSVGKAWADNERLKSQLAKYREVLEHLERFTSDNPDYEFINHRLKEALKQEG